MFDFTGTRFDFTVAEGMADRVTLRFTKSRTAEKVNLAGSTWQFRAKNSGNGASVAGLAIEHGENMGELVLLIPVLKAGEYSYELFATDAAGDINRVFYGVFTAITSEHGAKLVKAAYKEVARTLDVVVPVVNGAKLELRWVSCSVAEAAAATAVDAIDKAKAEADRAKQEADRAGNEADRAEGAADGVRDELNNLITRADNAVAKVEDMEGRLNKIDNHIREAIRVNTTTNTWWIAGVDTGVQVTGNPGQSPKLDADGYWLVYDDKLHGYINTGINSRGEDGRCPIVGSSGNWLHWNQKTQQWEDSGVPALGKDGINGSAVRRIIVNDVDDIPTEGETCNGGVYYYIPLMDAQPVAVIDVLDAEAGGFTVNGRSIGYTDQESREAAAGAVAEALETVFDTLPGLRVETDGSRVILTADILGWTFEALDTGRYAVEEHVRMRPLERYDVYAWLEQQDGTSGWVCVGEASDIATSEIYGLVKTGTDVVVRDGAPVGNNAKGQMSVPMAEQETSGSVRISFPDMLDDGGRIGYDMDKRLRGEPATILNYGDVKLSYSGEGMTNGDGEGTIGRRPDGTIGVRWATLDAPGVIRLGSAFGQLNRIPYQQGVGATADHKIVNNILFKGALQHQKLAGWINMSSMPWLERLRATITEDDSKYLNNSDFYFGLYTSIQFEQSEERGLVLLPATTGMIAGVYIASSMDDERDAAVPTASTVREWSLQTHYTKDETYTRQEVEGLLEPKLDRSEIEDYKEAINNRCDQHEEAVDAAISSQNKTIARQLSAQNDYIRTDLFTKDEFNTAKEVFMTRTENWHGSVIMSENDYNDLAEIDPATMYFLTAEE